MASSTVRSAVRTRLQALSLAGWTYVETVNGTPRPDAGSKWMTLEFPGGTETPISVGAPGSNIHRESAFFLVQLFETRGAGHSAIESAADTVRAGFRSWRDSGSNLRTFGADPPITLDDDGFYRAQIAVTYEFDNFG